MGTDLSLISPINVKKVCMIFEFLSHGKQEMAPVNKPVMVQPVRNVIVYKTIFIAGRAAE